MMPIYRGTTPLKAYKGDMQPVNIYRGSTKVAGWHAQTVSGEGTISLDGAYNVPPDALVIDGKCQQTVGVWGTNLVTNGDFSNGTNGWDPDGAKNLYVSNNVLFFTPATKYGGVVPTLLYRFPSIAGHKYYTAFEMKTIDTFASTYLIGINGIGGNLFVGAVAADGIFHRKSAVISCTTSSASMFLKPQSTANSAWSEIAVRYLIAIDITAAFGAGNEPTATQMDAYLAAYPNSWFDGSALLTTSGIPNSPSPTYPAPITTITGDLSITGANGDLSDTVVTPLGSVELCSLTDGTKDTYDAVTGVVTKRAGKYVGASGTSWEITDAATDASFISDKIQPGTLAGQTLTAISTCAPTVYYALAAPTTVQLTPHLPVVRAGIKTLSVGADVVPTLSAAVKSMD